MNFIEQILEQLHQNPNQPMVTEMIGAHPKESTGHEVLSLVRRGQHHLNTLGIQSGDRVVLIAPNSVCWVAADLAILAAGAIVVPMYARQDGKELVEMMHDCTPTRVIVSNALIAEKIVAHWPDAPITLLDTLFSGVEEATTGPVPRTQNSDATIIYTSGSTGTPKGVVTTVENTDFMLDVTRTALAGLLQHSNHQERVFHYLPFCFAGSRIMLWTQLLRGLGIVVSTDLEQLIDEMKGAQPTYFLNVPMLLERIKNGVEAKIRQKPAPIQWLYDSGKAAFMRMETGEKRRGDSVRYRLARRIVFQNIRTQIGPKLECLICGSAPLGEDTQRWFQMLRLPVYQIYGLTETTAIVSIDTPDKVEPGRVGPMIPGIETKLGPGDELLVRGPNIFDRYWNRPDATAAAFDGEWFKTGDCVEINTLGNLKIIGRAKNLLIPTSGHNVAPEPIEQQLVETIEGVEQAVLIGHGKAFITAIITGEVSADQLQAGVDAVNASIPHYRRVRKFHHTDDVFTTENGLLTANQKIRRAAIEAQYAPQIEAMYQ